MDLQLSGKRAVVTGASRGIGLATARALAAEGARVALVARDLEALRAAADVVEGAPVIAVCDTGDSDSVAAMARLVTGELGRVDILVNCAARANTGPMGDDELAEQINVKVAGYLRCARAFAPQMARARLGADHQRERACRALDRLGRRVGPQRRGRGDDEEPRRRVRRRPVSTSPSSIPG